MTIRIGLIGAGRMGKVFAHTLAFNVTEVDLVSIVDTDETTAREVATRYNVPNVFTDYHRMFDEIKLDAVVITTPTATHLEVIRAATAAGGRGSLAHQHRAPGARQRDGGRQAVRPCANDDGIVAVGHQPSAVR